ncbi:RNA-binding protein [Bradyrhizobium sp. SZCCHNR2026]|uniref:RNA-binding protein n=1 Tax=Bradyrhizobium sp. SZCCHNR2026 TaxID=3057381 RepID=UPI00291647C2|nr:RNA-binding protein [Bradyrhizobium sp. SZCCHNR2026]
MIAKIATGEIEETTTEDGKNAAAVALGRMGGKQRAKLLSPEDRQKIARKAAKTRWQASPARGKKEHQ